MRKQKAPPRKPMTKADLAAVTELLGRPFAPRNAFSLYPGKIVKHNGMDYEIVSMDGDFVGEMRPVRA